MYRPVTDRQLRQPQLCDPRIWQEKKYEQKSNQKQSVNKQTKARSKEKPPIRRRHAETDGQRQQDKKPHHLLLYLLDLISGVNIIGQKYTKKALKNRDQNEKKQEHKRQKAVSYSPAQKHSTVDEAGTANRGVCLFD